MLDDAEAKGLIIRGETTLVEATSGNTGISIAMLARERDYKCTIVMPESVTMERRLMLLALGANVVLLPKKAGMVEALAKAEQVVADCKGTGYLLRQFDNPANTKAHRESTGPEIWRDTAGTIDIFVAGVGTGGTLTGVTQYIKGSAEHDCPPKNPKLQAIAVEPREQMLITQAKRGEPLQEIGPHFIQGMGAGVIPKVLDLDLIDEAVPIHSMLAMNMTKQLWLKGLPVGVSSGANVAAALQVCQRPESANKTVVCVLPSFGERYFSHPVRPHDPVPICVHLVVAVVGWLRTAHTRKSL